MADISRLEALAVSIKVSERNVSRHVSAVKDVCGFSTTQTTRYHENITSFLKTNQVWKP
jgi:hypothetical protein